MNKKGDSVADLTLDEYKDVSNEKLSRILKEEARIICGVDLPKDNFRKTTNDLYLLFHHPKKTVIHRRGADA